MPLISVIVPVYKVESYLMRCVDSILCQSFTDFELILVDDGSPDNCPAICDEYAQKDNRIHVIHQKNGGLSSARNTGIDWAFANSDSNWLTFIDSDDWVDKDFLEQLYVAATFTGSNVSICGFKRTNELDEVPRSSSVVTCFPEEFYVNYQVLATVAWGKLYVKECFLDIRYPEGRYHEDEFVTHRILFKEEKIAFVNKPLYFYYVNETGITSTEWSIKRFMDARDAYIAEYDFLLKRGHFLACKSVAKSHVSLLQLFYSNHQQFTNRYLRMDLKKYKKVLNLSILKEPFLYERAFPKRAAVYWLCANVKNIIKKDGIVGILTRVKNKCKRK